jgi:hypothetical protein
MHGKGIKPARDSGRGSRDASPLRAVAMHVVAEVEDERVSGGCWREP